MSVDFRYTDDDWVFGCYPYGQEDSFERHAEGSIYARPLRSWGEARARSEIRESMRAIIAEEHQLALDAE